MTALCRLLMVVFALSGTTVLGGEPNEPLPKGAKVRLGTGAWLRGHLLGPDFKTMLTLDTDQGIGIREVATGRLLRAAKGEAPDGQLLASSADGTRIVTWKLGVVKVWETASGKTVAELKPGADVPSRPHWGDHSTNLTAASADAQVLAFGAFIGARKKDDKEPEVYATVWSANKGGRVARVRVAEALPTAPALSADGALLATWGVFMNPPPGTVRPPDLGPTRVVQIWDVASEKELAQVRVAGAKLTAVVFSPSGDRLATSCGDGRIQLWDCKTGKLTVDLLGRTGQGRTLAFSPDGASVAAIASDLTVERWAVDDGRFLGATPPPVTGCAEYPGGIAFLDKTRVIAWGSLGYVAACWEVPSRKLISPITDLTGPVRSISFLTDKQVLTSALDGRLIRWDAATGKVLGTLAPRAAKTPGIAFDFSAFGVELSPDGTRGLGRGRVLDLSAGEELFVVPNSDPKGNVSTYDFPSLDISKVAVVTRYPDAKTPPVCRVWDVETRRLVTELTLPPTSSGPTISVAFSPDRTRLVTACLGRPAPGQRPAAVFTGWDLATGKKLGEVTDPDVFGSVTITAANNTDAVYGWTDGFRAVDFAAGKLGPSLEKGRGQGATDPPVFSSDGKRFAGGYRESAGGEYGARVYEWPSGKVLHTFAGHSRRVTALRFSPDGKTLASGSDDATVLLWDLTAPAPK